MSLYLGIEQDSVDSWKLLEEEKTTAKTKCLNIASRRKDLQERLQDRFLLAHGILSFIL